MIGPEIEKPFGEDEDANAAARSIMSVVSELSIQSKRLAHTGFRNVNAMHAQRQLVQELRERVESAARRVHVGYDDMLMAAQRLLKKRTSRDHPIFATPAERPHMDPAQRELDREVLILREKLSRSEETLKRVTTRVANERADLARAEAAARAHQRVQMGRTA